MSVLTAFQMVHFQIAAGGVISPSHTKWDADCDFTLSTATRRNSRLRSLWDCNWI